MDVDISRSSHNSYGLPRVMSIRSLRDQLDEGRREKHRQLYESRRKNRLEKAGRQDKFSVSFANVTIREYPIVLGDNPACSEGPPMEIGWKHFSQKKWKFDTYEDTRPVRRTYHQMNVPMQVRIQMLQRSGESYKSIVKRAKEVKAMRIKRLETTQQLYKAKSQEKMERIGRGLRNLFSNNKKMERDLMEKTKYLSEFCDEDLDEYEAQLNAEIEEERSQC